METIKELAARRILARRKDLGLSQARVAELAGMPMRSYQRVEDPEHTLSVEVLAAVAAALGIGPWEILRPEGAADSHVRTLEQAKAKLAEVGALLALPPALAALIPRLSALDHDQLERVAEFLDDIAPADTPPKVGQKGLKSS